MNWGEVLGQIGAVVGAVGTGAVGANIPRLKKGEKTAQKALTLAEEAISQFSAFKVAFRAELESLKSDLDRVKRYRARAAQYAEDAPPRRASDSRPDLLTSVSVEELQRRNDQRMDELRAKYEELRGRCDELRAELLRERGARHALQHELTKQQQEFSKYVVGQGESWNEIHRTLGQIEGKLQRDSD